MLKLYQTTDDENVINKTLNHMKDFNIKFKNQFSIISPEIKLRITDNFEITECNYAYISDFKRYYFITNIQLISDDIYVISLECDVLESFKEDILNSYVKINRALNEGDYIQISNITDLRKEMEMYYSNVTLNSEKTLILTTMGGG